MDPPSAELVTGRTHHKPVILQENAAPRQAGWRSPQIKNETPREEEKEYGEGGLCKRSFDSLRPRRPYPVPYPAGRKIEPTDAKVGRGLVRMVRY